MNSHNQPVDPPATVHESVTWSVHIWICFCGGWGGGGIILELSTRTWRGVILYGMENMVTFLLCWTRGRTTRDCPPSPTHCRCWSVDDIELLISRQPLSCQCSVWCGDPIGCRYLYIIFQCMERHYYIYIYIPSLLWVALIFRYAPSQEALFCIHVCSKLRSCCKVMLRYFAGETLLRFCPWRYGSQTLFCVCVCVCGLSEGWHW